MLISRAWRETDLIDRNYVLLRLQIWLTKLSVSTYFDLVVNHILINKLVL